MAEIRASFFLECEELLEALQDGLLALDGGDKDPETINICFRAVHSIKGGAGAFGLDDLVRFAHRYETVLDAIRNGTLTPDHDTMLLFFKAADFLSDLVRSSQTGDGLEPDLVEGTLLDLESFTGDAVKEEEAATDFEPMAVSLDLSDFDLPSGTVYRVIFAPEPELFKSGNEPQHLLRALAEAGTARITCDSSKLPRLEALDPENAYLSWTVDIETEVSAEDLTELFDFVDGLCSLVITEVSNAPPDKPDLPAPPPDAVDISNPGAPLASPTLQKSNGTRPTQTPNATVRVDLDRIDRLVNLVGELVINQAMLSQSVAEAGLTSDSQVTSGLEEFMRLTRDIQDSVMMIRAQPVKSMFQRMSRIARETSGAIGKRVNFLTEGDNTEVDKTVIERLADPLTHMIRNAVDHGLESKSDRLAAGKSEEGTITLSAAHKSGRVIIEISDDGDGINRPKVKQIAETRGLIPPGQDLSDHEIDALLFLPGFSTMTQVSDLSGRGVGMDVVRSAIQSLGGRISITSVKGRGTTFSISLPLTLAVLDGMVITVDGETLVVPLSAIVETISLMDDDVKRLGPDTNVIHIRDVFVPLVDLGVELGYRSAPTDYEGRVVLLISQEDGARMALLVDTIEEQRQVVIKGLQATYGRVPGIAAATILGDGKIALIVDPVDLMTRASGKTGTPSEDLQLAG
ncbi:chemotaxis protein CheA [Actibacterium sp. 188UL27-1]|uniref:chemotaxis protein CheA n=1 Tax=Actibacterium sp. 188UL27-1 TaxID=2786961 RepID=UPI00195C381A|nr:chemotaxis protein CheA [Actibacterium sp. 188UL27-1]MBM7067815.1 chemotaxis protein CheA [Actibacterium sp. 188UL27-1]